MHIFVWTKTWWCILGSMVMEVEPLDIEAANVASRKFCHLYVAWEKEALSNGDNYNWRVKTKLHLFAELMQVTIKTSGTPQLFWTYLDEGWNAWLAQAARPRGGRSVPGTISLKLLQRFRAYMDKLMSPNLCAFLSHFGPA